MGGDGLNRGIRPHRQYAFGLTESPNGRPRVNILANSAKGRNKQISENEEEIKGFYCLALKNEEENKEKEGEEIRNSGQNIYPRTFYVFTNLFRLINDLHISIGPTRE